MLKVSDGHSSLVCFYLLPNLFSILKKKKINLHKKTPMLSGFFLLYETNIISLKFSMHLLYHFPLENLLLSDECLHQNGNFLSERIQHWPT